MGMFDLVQCEYHLKENPNVDNNTWQSKDTPSQCLDVYKIDKDGKLWYERYDIEDKSNPDATGIDRILGMISKTNHRWIFCKDFNGNINFYNIDDSDKLWEYSARFDNGILVVLELIKPVVSD